MFILAVLLTLGLVGFFGRAFYVITRDEGVLIRSVCCGVFLYLAVSVIAETFVNLLQYYKWNF